ncbi:hypothetical protein B566_EDAN016567, partial [Ephemera danica]
MKNSALLVLFVSAITLLLILNLNRLQEDALQTTKLEGQQWDTVDNCPKCAEEKKCLERKCPNCSLCDKEKICEKCPDCLKCSECPVQSTTCPEPEICSTVKPLPIPKNVIKMSEMTEVLNVRDFSKEAIFFTETSGIGVIKPRFVCALESAARVYPLGDVYLLVAYNPTDELQVDSNEALDMVL